ncbi:YqaJ viral recombinase family protein, partial [Hafnia paralvei]|uniref:YqaJ viral recombinase family protein n=1 Tax=Hafnia paralvei TaxID=546367 RepID=UPI0039FC668E
MSPELILQRTGIDVLTAEQGGEDWKSLRLGVVTASRAHAVLATGRGGKGWGEKKKSYLMELVAEVCTGQSPEIFGKPLEWGTEHEAEARTLFEFMAGKNVSTENIMFKDETLRTAASPDGICSDGYGLEIKCPFTTTVYLDFRVNGVIKPEYIAQCQYSMWVTGASGWYFANYDPRMKREGLHYV